MSYSNEDQSKRYLKSLLVTPVVLITVLSAWLQCFAEVSWQTTRSFMRTGDIKITDYKIHTKVYPYHANVTEEIVFTDADNSTQTGITGETLEIIGSLKLPKGAALRGALLWQDGEILKAWLVDREIADSLYEDAVQREDMTIVVPIDPVIIDFMGNSQYNFSIYPLESGSSRRLRILYSVLANVEQRPDTLAYDIRPSLLWDNTALVNEVSYTFEDKSSDQEFSFGTEYGYSTYRSGNIIPSQSVVRDLEFGSRYMHPGSGVNYMGYNSADVIWKDMSTGVYAVKEVTSGKTAGCYSWVQSKRPDSISNFISDYSDASKLSLEISGTMNGEQFYRPIDLNTKWLRFLKKEDACSENGITNWRVLKKSGGDVLLEVSDAANLLDNPSSAAKALPVLWAANYSLVEEKENLGFHYGFADKQMSLLALEEFALNEDDAAKYEEAGVPWLKDSEIKGADGYDPDIPESSILIAEGESTSDVEDNDAIWGSLDALEVVLPEVLFSQIMVDGLNVEMIVGDASGNLQLTMVDVKGQVVARWAGSVHPGQSISMNLNSAQAGIYWVIGTLNGKKYRQSFRMDLR